MWHFKKTMKPIAVIFLSMIFTSCNFDKNGALDVNQVNEKNDSTAKHSTTQNFQLDLSPIEALLRMYDLTYELRMEPTVVNEKLISSILLTSNRDTVFLKKIAIDTLYNGVRTSDFFEDSINYSSFLDEYVLIRTTPSGIRNSNIYFESVLKSKKENSTKYILFSINYLEDAGRFMVNGIYNKSFEGGNWEGFLIKKSAT